MITVRNTEAEGLFYLWKRAVVLFERSAVQLYGRGAE
jgi:hypothetical protein